MHREPSRAAPAARENRGHRRLPAPLLPVSRLITACHVCTITHAGMEADVFNHTMPGDLLPHGVLHVLLRKWMWLKHVGGNTPVCEYGMKYVLKLE